MTLSREEFRDAMARLYDTTKTIAEDLKELGLRLAAGDVTRENMRVRLEAIEAQLEAQHLHRRADDPPARSRARTASLAGVGLLLLVVMLKLLLVSGEFALELLKALVKTR